MITTAEKALLERPTTRRHEEKQTPQRQEKEKVTRKLSIDVSFEDNDLTKPLFSLFNYEGDTFKGILPELALILKSSKDFEIELRLPPALPPERPLVFGTEALGLPAIQWIHRETGVVASALKGARLGDEGRTLTLSWKEPQASRINTSILGIAVERGRVWGWLYLGVLFRPESTQAGVQTEVFKSIDSPRLRRRERQLRENRPASLVGEAPESAEIKVEIFHQDAFGIRYSMFNYPDIPNFDLEPAFMLGGDARVLFRFEFDDDKSDNKFRFSEERFKAGGNAVPSFRSFDLLTHRLQHGYPSNLRNIAFPGDDRKRADVELQESNPDFKRWGFTSFFLLLEQENDSTRGDNKKPKRLLADPTVVCNPPEPLP